MVDRIQCCGPPVPRWLYCCSPAEAGTWGSHRDGHILLATPRPLFVGYAQYIYHLLPLSFLQSTDVTQFSDKRRGRLVIKVVSRIYFLSKPSHMTALLEECICYIPLAVRCDQVRLGSLLQNSSENAATSGLRPLGLDIPPSRCLLSLPKSSSNSGPALRAKNRMEGAWIPV